MKKIRIFGKVMGIFFGALGLSAMMSSCKKERTCSCTTSYSYSDGPNTYSYSTTNTVTATIKKCSDLNTSSTQAYGSYTYTTDVTCVK